jgi:hypothetical protein
MPSGRRASAIIDQQKIGPDGFSKQNCGPLAEVQSGQGIGFGRFGRYGKNFEPVWRLLHPVSHGGWSGGRYKLVSYLDGCVYSFEEAGQNVNSADENQVMQRCRVGDNDTHLLAKAQPAQGRPFTFQVFRRISQPHFMSL